MTREQKLALIVGFSLILFVGVLISDHLSGARKARIAKVAPELAQAPISVAPVPPPGPAPETQVAANQPVDSQIQMLGRSIEPPITISATPQSQPQPLQPDTRPAAPESSTIRVAGAGDPALAEEIRRAGGEFVRTADGASEFKLPAAAEVRPTPQSSPVPPPRQNPPTINTVIGPIEQLKTHAVKSGETLFQITNRYYGDGNLWRDLARFNGLDKSGTLRQGAQLKIPSKDILLGRAVANSAQKQPEVKLLKPAPGAKPIPPKAAPAIDRNKPKLELASYTVRKGDTLGEISLRTLGSSRRWPEIAELNKLDDEDALSAGTVLKIPAKRS